MKVLKKNFLEVFDPIELAINYFQEGELDEACWLLFLYSYIGKHPKYEWNLLKKVYYKSDTDLWNWKNINNNFEIFENWLVENLLKIKDRAGFGEYHKYSHFDNSKITVMCKDIHEYIKWVKESKNHECLLENAKTYNSEPSKVFHALYKSIDNKTSFNKLIKFTYLTLNGNLGIFPIKVGHSYLNDFILSKRGAQYLFENKNRKKISLDKLNELLILLSDYLDLNEGLQILQKILATWGEEKFRKERQSFKKYH
ncbi:hypothetical protein [Chryseobacterium sp. MMS23-Vi53]|uniref:alpha-glutamyl/putrescinyl thymine pyrophosphorylase clade 3 protein n=1 Tax=Chryseobacterium sp. MMS23-Vi53 TaxID=3386644 RepID=UPI0039E74E78